LSLRDSVMRANKQEKSFAIRITPRKFDTIKNVF
jgi:hypothetical protein